MQKAEGRMQKAEGGRQKHFPFAIFNFSFVIDL